MLSIFWDSLHVYIGDLPDTAEIREIPDTLILLRMAFWIT